MIINVLFPDEREKVKEYLTLVKGRNALFPIPLWKLKINSKPVPGGVFVCFRINVHLPITYFLLFGTIACGLLSLFVWSYFYVGCILFFVLSLFTGESFFYFGIKKGWGKFGTGKLKKLSSRKALDLLLESRNAWDR